MKSKFFQVLIGIIVASVALYFGFRDIQFSDIFNEIKTIRIEFVGLAVLIMIFSHWLRAFRWKLFFNQTEINHSKTYPFFSSTMIGYALNNIIPRGGEIGKAVYLSKKLNISQSKVLGTVVLERLIDFISLILIFGITSLTYSAELNHYFPGLGLIAILIFIGSFVAILVFTFTPVKILFKFSRNILSIINKKLAIKIARLIVSFAEGIGSLKQSDRLIQIVIISALIWFCYTLMTWVPLFSFAFQDKANLSFIAAIAIMTISSIGVILPSPGGTGTFHLFCSSVLVQLFNIDHVDALSYATVVYLMNISITSLLGVLVFLLDQINKSKSA